MEPRVLKQDNKFYLSYEVQHRIRCSAIYPASAPNGATIILYGHDKGLRVLWRGGRRIKEARTQQSDGDIVLLDSTEPAQAQNEYEDEVEELDPDCPYPDILYDLDIPFPSAVTKLATVDTTTGKDGRIALALATGQVIYITLPLDPIFPGQALARVNGIVEHGLTTLQHESAGYVHDLALKSDGDRVIVAALTNQLSIWHVSGTNVKDEHVDLLHSPKSISFHPAAGATQLLITDIAGLISIYETAQRGEESRGYWHFTVHAPFVTGEVTKARASRKKILAARWVMNGRCILAIFDDGQWGIWDLTASQPGKGLEDFVLSGYLGSAASNNEPVTQKRGAALAPMTPNTRKQKSGNLFGASTKQSATRGIISVSKTSNATGMTDESILLSHNDDLFTIPSTQSFWQRASSGGGVGSLYSPGIAHVQPVNLFNEPITSLSQFGSRNSASNTGRLNTQRDFVLSTEHRLIIVHSKTQSAAVQLFQKPALSEVRDQRMLDAGELDLNGMDRILGNMDDDARSRKVGFAH